MNRGGVALYDLHARLSDSDFLKMRKDFSALNIKEGSSQQVFFGGEILCGKNASLKRLLDACAVIQQCMIERKHVSDRGDEFLLYSAGVAGLLPPVSSANPYIARCWTGRYYSVPHWENYAILHLPAEKVYSFPRAFEKLARSGSIESSWFEKSCGLRVSRRPISPRWAVKRICDKVKQR